MGPETPPVEDDWFTEIRRVVGNWWLVGQLAYWLNLKKQNKKQSKYMSQGLHSLLLLLLMLMYHTFRTIWHPGL